MKRNSASAAALANKPHALYRFYDRADVLLYVGISVNLPTRINKHRATKQWWAEIDHITIEHFPTRPEVLAAETQAIKDEQPLYNIIHNEAVLAADDEECDPEDQVRDFVMSALGFLDADERARVVERARTTWDGRTLGEEEAFIAAGNSALSRLGYQRSLLKDAMTSIFCFLPVEQWSRCEEVAAIVLGDEFHHGDARATIETAKAFRTEMADAYLSTLPPEERDEWLECATNQPSLTKVEELVRFAADYAKGWKEAGWRPFDVCGGTGKHGARCPSWPTVIAWIVGCPHCVEDGGSHRWCEFHLERARSGDVRTVGGILLEVQRFEVIDRDSWSF